MFASTIALLRKLVGAGLALCSSEMSSSTSRLTSYGSSFATAKVRGLGVGPVVEQRVASLLSCSDLSLWACMHTFILIDLPSLLSRLSLRSDFVKEQCELQWVHVCSHTTRFAATEHRDVPCMNPFQQTRSAPK